MATGATAPNFLIVGVQKAGTTFLARALSEHPDVFFARPKELFFFNTAQVSNQDFDEYLRTSFIDVGGRRWVGEGSTNYFHHAKAIQHIHQFLGPETRIMACLRHPVERLFSHYLHDYKRGRRTGREGIDDPAFVGYLSRSLYADRIRTWRSRFPNLEILFFDDLVANAYDFYRQATDFLDITPQAVADTPVNEGLRLGWKGDVLTLRTARPGQRLPQFSRAQVERLVRDYTGDVRETMELTGRDLSAWLEMPDFDRIADKFSAAGS